MDNIKNYQCTGCAFSSCKHCPLKIVSSLHNEHFDKGLKLPETKGEWIKELNNFIVQHSQ